MAPIIESFIRQQSGDEAGHKTAITSLRLGIISGEDGEAAATRVQSHYDVTEAAGRVIPPSSLGRRLDCQWQQICGGKLECALQIHISKVVLLAAAGAEKAQLF